MTEDERPLGPWMKLYADIVYRKAHYDDHQFRVLINAYSLALTMRGKLPPKRALEAMWGAEVVAFLVEEGDLIDNVAWVEVHRWNDYQSSPADPTGAERQRRWRDNHRNVTRNAESVMSPSSSSSVTSTTEKTEVVPFAGAREEWPTLMTEAERLTHRPYALGQPTSKVGATALDQAIDFGLTATVAAWERVNTARPDPNVSLSAAQLVFGADSLLRPIPRVNGKQVAVEEEGKRDRAASERRRAETRRLIDEQKARERGD